MLHPDVLAAYLDEFRLAMADLRRDQIKARASIERRLVEIDAEEERIVDAIVAGMAPDKLKARSLALAEERATLISNREAEPEPLPLIHPSLVDGYRHRVQRIAIIAEADEATRAEGFALVRDLIEKIIATPRANGQRGSELELHGKLAALLQNEKSRPKEGGSFGPNGPTALLVAGARFQQCSGSIRIAA